ncbi:MAG: hypothetical protein U0667_08305 [Chloroflexota bacterium]
MTAHPASRYPLTAEERALVHGYARGFARHRIKRAAKVCAALAATAFLLTLPLSHAPIHEVLGVMFVGTFAVLFVWSLVGILVGAVLMERVGVRRLERVPPTDRTTLSSAIDAMVAASYGERPTSRSGMATGAAVACSLALAFGAMLVALGIDRGTAPTWLVTGVLTTLAIATSFGLLAGSGIAPAPTRPTVASLVTFAIGAGIAAAAGLAVVVADDADQIFRTLVDGSGAWAAIAIGSVIAAIAWAFATRALMGFRR